jgi:hypothetical protein
MVVDAIPLRCWRVKTPSSPARSPRGGAFLDVVETGLVDADSEQLVGVELDQASGVPASMAACSSFRYPDSQRSRSASRRSKPAP